VTYSQSLEGGTTTTLELCNPATFSQRAIDATEPSFGRHQSSEARAETPV